MSRFVADHLPDALVARLSADRALAHADTAIVICSIDEHGWPHPAMLSSLELVARDARNIRLAPHHRSRTARNLTLRGRVTVICADVDGVFYIKGDVRLISPSLTSVPELCAFNLRVDSVLQDVPQEYEAARILSGVRVARGSVDRERAEALLRELAAP
jgi:hypothetical protein